LLSWHVFEAHRSFRTISNWLGVHSDFKFQQLSSCFFFFCNMIKEEKNRDM